MKTETLTTEQQAAVDMAVKSVKDKKPVFRLGGYAGTGKTTVARHIVEELKGCMPCAFTGKAAYRLTQKGIHAQTIHKTIYDCRDGKTFTRKPYVDGDWFLIDEGSMVSAPIWNDLLSYGKPIVMLGDPGQLEPVGKDPRLMHKADVVLDQIHRQAEGNGIIQFATDIRLDKFWLDPNIEYTDEVELHHGENPTVRNLRWADIILCGFNATRMKMNKVIRSTRGHTGLLNPGEKIIVLNNNRDFGVFNGQILTVESLSNDKGRTVTAKCVNDEGWKVEMPLYKEQFGHKSIDARGIADSSTMVLADYGYCITVHKSQGSEWDKVLVIDEQLEKCWEAKRWRYTAITRAAKELKYYFK